ncbi:hypothetical protein AB0K60_29610 [Thermopolyspora sp. NPDC052614]|uniref:hypothetical protein n=1 Tax=Thermopolyspora sp. NPDC052614 TaxID=3155682 RepID=UPI00341D1370
MSPTTTVAELADALRREAVRLDEGKEAESEAERITKKTELLKPALGKLERAVDAARQLHRLAGTPNLIDLSVAADGLANFAAHVRRGRPVDQAFTAARNKIEGAASAILRGVESAWTEFTQGRLSELPLRRIALLPAAERRSQRHRLDDLRKLAQMKQPTSSDMQIFNQTFTILREALEQLPDPEPALDVLFRKFESARVTLASLTDEEIALLRRAQVDDQFEVLRRDI